MEFLFFFLILLSRAALGHLASSLSHKRVHTACSFSLTPKPGLGDLKAQHSAGLGITADSNQGPASPHGVLPSWKPTHFPQ